MRNKMKGPVALKEILSQVISSPVEDEKGNLSALQENWQELVGPTLCRRSQPFRIYGKKLSIRVAGSSWANELDYFKPELLKRLRQSFPQLSIEEIRYISTISSGLS